MNKSRIGYTYAVLRYVHDVVAGEFINVGVVVFAPRDGFALMRITPSLFRVSQAFSNVNTSTLKKHLNAIKAAVEAKKSCSDLSSILQSALPDDSNSLRWSDVGAGVARSAEQALTELFERLVLRVETRYQNDEPVHAFQMYRAEERHALAANNEWIPLEHASAQLRVCK